MVSVDSSVVVQVLNFLVLIWVLNMVLYKPVRKILSKRKQTFSGLESEIDVYNQKVIDKNNTYMLGIKDARLSGQKQKETIFNAALDEENVIINKINQDAQAELKEIKNQIKSEIDIVRISLGNDIEIFAKAIGHKILGRIV